MWWKKDRTDKRPFVSAVIPAAGSSTRMGEETNKLLIELDGMPVLARTLLVFERCPLVDEIVVACRESDIMPYARLCEAFGMQKVRQIVRGGGSRSESVLCGVKACAEQADFVAIHDAARPLLRLGDLMRVIEDAAEHGAACLVVPMKDSVKRVEDGWITADVARASLAAAQTPQVFGRKKIQRALELVQARGLAPTDDCAAAELAGMRVFATLGSYTNIKVTTPEDLVVAEAFLQEAEG
ncbi:MAG: 2-C-methyl-D-erythritol 4-phosphate cytidylyltransferase [Butyricicoccus pullicaecorum]|nr:2-C-methyl-D-erythritol 4-phosphate cytidylyltransferase [Butyricicoccus pullicaecorum]